VRERGEGKGNKKQERESSFPRHNRKKLDGCGGGSLQRGCSSGNERSGIDHGEIVEEGENLSCLKKNFNKKAGQGFRLRKRERPIRGLRSAPKRG